MKRIAVLLTCYNRKATTLQCLQLLFLQQPKNWLLEAYLVDDCSPDGTGQAVKEAYPAVHVLNGTGQLFWAGGMRMAWQAAAEKDYDGYLWLNDDTYLRAGALEQLSVDWRMLEKQNKIGLIVGSFFDTKRNEHISYGALTAQGKRVAPNGSPQYFDGAMGGNCVLVPREVFLRVGNLYHEFSHGIADYDYAYMVRKAKLGTYVASSVLGYCSANKKYADRLSVIRKMPLAERIGFFYSPKGGALREYCIFKRRHWGSRWIISWLNCWLKILFPTIFLR